MKDRIKLFFKTLSMFLVLGIDVSVYIGLLDKEVLHTGGSIGALKLGFLGSLFLFSLLLFINYRYRKKSNLTVNVLSIIFAVLMVIGYSYNNFGNSYLLIGSGWLFLLAIVMAIGYYFVFNFCLCILFERLDKMNVKDSTNKFMTFFKRYPFIVSMIVLLLAWLVYIIAFYPVILSPDPSYQIKQFFGIRTKYSDYAIMLDESVTITNHHPVMHTLLLGSCLKIGTLIGNDNLGLFIYSLIQILVLSGTLSYTIKYMMHNLSISNKICLLFLAIYAFVPVFPMYSMCAVKDVLFTSFVILYVLMLHNIISKNGDGFKLWQYVLMILLMLLVILFRNNGLYVIALSFPFLILVVKKFWKRYLLLFIIVMGLSTCYTKVLLPVFKITSGSIRETLSIPFQQTARYVKYHSDDLTQEDILVIDKVLGYDDLAERYDPEISDPVKNKFNKYTSNEELIEYFKVWFKGLVKHPITYIDATIENTYGYFYPEKIDWYIYYSFDNRILEDGFDYHYNGLSFLRGILVAFATSFMEIPILGLLINIGFSTWVVIFLIGYVIYKKEYKKIVLYLPAVISILVCVASPVNTYFRYAMPYIFGLPVMISFALNINNKKNRGVINEK